MLEVALPGHIFVAGILMMIAILILVTILEVNPKLYIQHNQQKIYVF